jgi:hypothetical protein
VNIHGHVTVYVNETDDGYEPIMVARNKSILGTDTELDSLLNNIDMLTNVVKSYNFECRIPIIILFINIQIRTQ